MPIGLGGGQGYLNFVQQSQQRELQNAALQQMLMQNQATQRAQDARGPAFEALARQLAPQAPGGGIPPPPPGSPAGGPQAPAPGANMAPPPTPQPQPMAPPQPGPPMPPQGGMVPQPPAAPGGAPAGRLPGPMGAASMPTPQIPPFRPMPTSPPPQGAPQAPGMIGPPPAGPAPDAGVSQPASLPLSKIVADLKQSGVPPAMAFDMLDQLTPIMNAQNKAELDSFKVINKAQEAAIHAYRATVQNEQALRSLDIKEGAEGRRQQQGDERLGINQQNVDVKKKKLDFEMGGAGGGFSEKDVAYWTEVLQKGGSLPPRLATTPGGKLLMQQVMKGTARGDVSPKDMLANQAEFMGEKAGQRTLGTRTANIEMAATEAAGLSGLALKASDEWERTGIKSLNDLEKYAQGKTASPTLRRFVAANTSFINAYARAINPQGVGTVADKEHAREMLEVGFAKGDYAAAIDQLQSEISVAQTSPSKVKESMRERFVGGGARKAAPQEALDYLKAHPDTASQFSAKYGYLPAGAR